MYFSGTNVLASKTELDKALDRRRWQQGRNEAKLEAEAAKTDFQKAMEQRAQRVNNVSITENASGKFGAFFAKEAVMEKASFV